MAAQKEASFAEGFDLFSAADLEAKEEVKPLLNHHEKELTAMGLGVPKVTQVCEKLRDMGLPIKDGIYTLEEAASELLKLVGKGGAVC